MMARKTTSNLGNSNNISKQFLRKSDSLERALDVRTGERERVLEILPVLRNRDALPCDLVELQLRFDFRQEHLLPRVLPLSSLFHCCAPQPWIPFFPFSLLLELIDQCHHRISQRRPENETNEMNAKTFGDQKRQWKVSYFTFLCSMHERLGAESPAQSLNQYVHRDIAELLRPQNRGAGPNSRRTDSRFRRKSTAVTS